MEKGPRGEAVEAVMGVDEGCGEELPATRGIHFLRDLLAEDEFRMVLLYTLYGGQVVVGGKISKPAAFEMSRKCLSPCGARNFLEYTVASFS